MSARTKPLKTKHGMPDLKDYMTTEEAAKALDLHPGTIRLFLRYKQLEGEKMGKTWLILRASVEKYKKANAGKSKHAPNREK